MHFLSLSDSDLHRLGAINTAKEIQQQPEVWMKVYNLLKENSGEITQFIKEIIPNVDEIILTGAGTSAYIGMCLVGDLRRSTGLCVQAVATTDLVTHPGNYFSRERSVLLVSFARSGNSPESCGALKLADKIAKNAYHLVITCDPSGDLFQNCNATRKYAIVLPEETNDKSLAMTSSFTGMLLAGLLVSRISNIENERENVDRIVSYGKKIIRDYLEDIKQTAALDFTRAIFLGSGPQLGTSRESQLKVQELTDGNIVCKLDSFLGFRHGPKAVTDSETLVVYQFSNQPYVLKYEADLVEAMKKGRKAMYQVGIFENAEIAGSIPGNIDLKLILSDEPGSVDEEYLSVCNVLPAQLIGFFKSLGFGLKPDSPSDSGAISRVVEGVKIYPFV